MAWEHFIPSLWGLGGAFCWAGPQLRVCLKACPPRWGDRAGCLWEFGIAMFAGALAAPSMGEVLAYRIPWLAEPQPYALWVATGLAAYPCSPLLLSIIKGRMSRMKDPHA